MADDQGSGDRNEAELTSPESAAQRAHGTHGRGDSREELDTPAVPLPDMAKGSDRGGSSGWGSEASGGNDQDKRPPKN